MTEKTEFMTFVDRIRAFLGSQSFYGGLTDEEIIKDWLFSALGHWLKDEDATAFAPFDAYFLAHGNFEDSLVDLVETELGNDKIGTVSGRLFLANQLLSILAFASNEVKPYFLNLPDREDEILSDTIFDFFRLAYIFDPDGSVGWARDAIGIESDFAFARSSADLPAPLEIFLEISPDDIVGETIRAFAKSFFNWSRYNTHEPDLSSHLPEIVELRLKTLEQNDIEDTTIELIWQIVSAPDTKCVRPSISDVIVSSFEFQKSMGIGSDDPMKELANNLRKHIHAELFAKVKRAHNTNEFESWWSVPFLSFIFFPKEEEFVNQSRFAPALRQRSLLDRLSA